jgi:hypothetical protein
MKTILLFVLILFSAACEQSQSFGISNANRHFYLPQKTKQQIVNGAFHVGAGETVYYQFSVSNLARLQGEFRAKGGKNDIYCAVVDDVELENLQNGNNFKAFYASNGYITRGRVNQDLSAGNYYLVFTNKAAWITNKTVIANFWIEE